MNKYDIIIVGSGLGGLECAAILSKEGYNVCVLEKNPLFGGCLQTFKYRKHLMDTGIHYVGSLDDGQIMNQYFKYLGIMDKLTLKRMDATAFDKIIYQGQSYNYAMGHENFVEQLAQHFPHQRQQLKRYTDKLQEVGRLIDIDTLKGGSISKNGMQYFYTSASGAIDEMFTDPTLKSVISGTSMLYGGQKDFSTFYHHAMINNSYIESSYRFVDGTMQIADQLIDIILRNGGTVLNKKEVSRFIVEDGEITAVEVNNEELFEAQNFISNIHPKRTFELVDKTRTIKKAYLTRINSLPNSFGIFTLYLIMKKDTELYQNTNIYVHGRDDVWYTADTSLNQVCYSLICHQCNAGSKYSDVVTILSPIEYSEFAKWENTTAGHRGDEYKAMKEAYSLKILDYLKHKGYDFTDKIESMFSTTPLSYRDYTGTSNGAVYGIAKDYRFPELSFISTKTKLKNLYLTGQNMNVHGALGVTLTAMYTCADFLGQEYLAKKVGNV